MSGGEHYFHTPEQLLFLRNWVREQVYEENAARMIAKAARAGYGPL